MNTKDGLICGVCHGEKVLKNPVGKSVLCPQCGGRGYLPNSQEIKEQQQNKKSSTTLRVHSGQA